MRVYPALPTGDPHARVIHPVVRAVWSIKKDKRFIEREHDGQKALVAWKNEEVALLVDTKWCKEGASLKLKVHTAGKEDEVWKEESGTIQNGSFLKDGFKLDFGDDKNRNLKDPFTPMVFLVEVSEPKVKARSNVLLVMKDAFTFST